MSAYFRNTHKSNLATTAADSDISELTSLQVDLHCNLTSPLSVHSVACPVHELTSPWVGNLPDGISATISSYRR